MKAPRRAFLSVMLLLLLLLQCLLAQAHPWFNGWCTRITDLEQGRTLTLILGSFQTAAKEWSEVYTALLVGEHGRVRSEQVFSDPETVSMRSGGEVSWQLSKRDHNRNAWHLPLGTFQTNSSGSNLDFELPGLRFRASLGHPKNWDPEGWAGRLPPWMLPTHYFVESLSSPVEYELNGEFGRGYAHQEMNYGRRFPVAFVWAQGIADGGRSQLVVTGGKFTVSGVTTEQYIVAFRSEDHEWSFRSIDLHRFRAKVDACNGSFSLVARTSNRRLELMVSAPRSSFSQNIYVPTEGGFSHEPGSSESHTALAVARLFAKRGIIRNSQAISEYTIFKHAALEFGGEYNCGAGHPAPSLAFVGPGVRPRPRQRRPLRPKHREAQSSMPRQSYPVAAACAVLAATALALRSRRKRTLQEGIADFYDASTGVWVEIWGDHLHHGYYEDNSWRSLQQHREAQVRMIEEVLTWAADGEKPQNILDVGCGVGGSSRYLQKKFNAQTTGITLSPKQCSQATSLSKKTGQEQCSFKVADALKMPFPDNSFDLVWSLESGEHMPEKPKFMAEMNRVCKPGGRIILVTWVHRDLDEHETLKPKEQRLLDCISKAYHLPDWCSIADYSHIAKDMGMTGIKTTDWTKHIAPFWSAVIQSALQPRGWWALLRGGLETFRGALVMPLMNRGYRTGTICFGLLTACKAESEEGAKAAAGSATARAALPHAPRVPRVPRVPPRRWLSRLGRRATDQAISSASTTSGLELLKVPKAIWDFTRPHTLIGTFVSITAVHLFAVAPVLGQVHWWRFALLTVQALVPAMLINVYITGLNQIYDVDIDRQNKPYLPIPSGRLSLKGAWRTVLASLLAAEVLSCTFCTPLGFQPLQFALLGSALLGTLYSAPPARLKRYPFLAALSIIVVRGIVVNMGFYAYIAQALGIAGQLPPLRSAFAASFFAVFGLVIALMKDVPDVLGDQSAGVYSLSVRLGPKRVFSIAVGVLKALLLCSGGCLAAAGFAGSTPRAALRGLLAAFSLLFLRAVHREEKRVDAEDPKKVFDFYMFVWKIFYAPQFGSDSC
ncbi:unnamed protein product [Effrenium voratum]|nr:unnamed protein product [Effrenium voratum]